MKTKTKAPENHGDLVDQLADIFHKMGTKEISEKEGRSRSVVAGKLIAAAKTEFDMSRLMEKDVELPFFYLREEQKVSAAIIAKCKKILRGKKK